MNEFAISYEMKPIAVEMLRPDAALDFDLFLRRSGSQQPVLFRGREYPLAGDDLKSLVESGVQTLYIAADEAEAYERYLREQVLANGEIPPAARYQMTREAFRTGFIEALCSDCPERIVQSALSVATEIVGVVGDDELILADLFAVMRHDYCTFTHATNVCAYCVALSTALGIADPETLRKIAVGALLHDLGKRKLPPAILQKTGKLTDEEFERVKKHPGDGFAELAGRPDLEWAQLMMVYQHHERPDGRGYPVGVEGDELHPWAAMCSVVDVFDALTSDRPYRKPAPVSEALGFLRSRAGKQFDSEMAKCWIQTVTRRR